MTLPEQVAWYGKCMRVNPVDFHSRMLQRVAYALVLPITFWAWDVLAQSRR